MARCAMQHAVVLSTNRIVVGADGVAGAQARALKGRPENSPEALRDFDEAAERALIAGGRGVEEDAATDRFAWASCSIEVKRDMSRGRGARLGSPPMAAERSKSIHAYLPYRRSSDTLQVQCRSQRRPEATQRVEDRTDVFAPQSRRGGGDRTTGRRGGARRRALGSSGAFDRKAEQHVDEALRLSLLAIGSPMNGCFGLASPRCFLAQMKKLSHVTNENPVAAQGASLRSRLGA